VSGVVGEVASEGKVCRTRSVAMQSESMWRNRFPALSGEPAQPFKYWDKGFMATIGRGAVVEFPNQNELFKALAYFAWLGCT